MTSRTGNFNMSRSAYSEVNTLKSNQKKNVGFEKVEVKEEEEEKFQDLRHIRQTQGLEAAS
jgi:hypothetical protein